LSSRNFANGAKKEPHTRKGKNDSVPTQTLVVGRGSSILYPNQRFGYKIGTNGVKREQRTKRLKNRTFINTGWGRRVATILRDYERERKNLYYTWSAFDHDTRRFVNEVREKGLVFNGVCGMPRGGLILAVCLSHHLGIPLLYHSFDADTLIVDDIVDSGSTSAPFFGKNYIFALWFNPRRSKIVTPNMWYHEKPEDQFIIFPWEAES